MHEPTQLKKEDIDKLLEKTFKRTYQSEKCFKCGNDFLPNYGDRQCDECYFSQFPKKQVQEFYRSFFE